MDCFTIVGVLAIIFCVLNFGCLLYIIFEAFKYAKKYTKLNKEYQEKVNELILINKTIENLNNQLQKTIDESKTN